MVFNISQLILLGVHMCNPPGSYARSLCVQTPSINLYKVDTFFNKPKQHLPNHVSLESLGYVIECVTVGARQSVSGSECLCLSVQLWFIAAHYDLLFALINSCHSVLQLNAADCYDLSIQEG